MDHFEVFGLPRRLRIDEADLQRRFYKLARRHHPDFQAQAAPDEQARALEASAGVNAAYRALRHPIARIEYLVRLEEGRETKEGATVKPKAPPVLLEEMFEIQEALAEAKAGGLTDEVRATLSAQRERLIARYRDEEARLQGPLAEGWDVAAPAERPARLAALKEALATRAYLRTVVDDLGAALGDTDGRFTADGEIEGRDRHVAHHRH
ncbi:MAG: Fe-S protein assembly co-chaperone HscB [Candidatus Rokubacteria bacterium]|nr:Fe-S protein assembly co-chaperone HscB [Candidatus Rokubacteria bacterium]MBI3827168.1 Fe-S protein assembly co-chaperone HscB [Candidatus Rokubacteria bacterium]